MVSLKLITIGEAGVGKTALTLRYANNSYGFHEMTIGVDFATKQLSNGTKLQIWDTAGQESFRSISRSYYRGADAAIAVFAMNNKQSFNKIKFWIDDFRSINNTAVVVLVGSKCELNHEVSQDQITELFHEYNISYFECSAKENMNVSLPFEYIIDNCKPYVPDISNTTKLSNEYKIQYITHNCC